MRLAPSAAAALLAALLAACESGPAAPHVEPADIRVALDACMAGDGYRGAERDSLRALGRGDLSELDGVTVGIARLDSLLEVVPGHADALAIRGQCRAVRFAADSVQADARAAFNDLTSAIDAITARPGVFETPLGALYNQRAFVVEAMRPGDWDAALADFRRAATLDARNSAHVLDLGVAHAMAGDTAAARAALRRFLALAPADTARADALRGMLGDPAVDTSSFDR